MVRDFQWGNRDRRLVHVFHRTPFYELTLFMTILCRSYGQQPQSLESGICVSARGKANSQKDGWQTYTTGFREAQTLDTFQDDPVLG